jgi:serine/threonine-protein kinase
LLIEEQLFQKYRLIKHLGSGGSADVFLAEHKTLSAYRAIKRISKKEKLHDFWLQEAGILKNLSHPSIPTIYDLEEDDSYSYIIMEYLEGVSLKIYRKEHEMTEQEIGEFSLQICRLLRYLHELPEPLLFLDLKPENLMVCDGTIKIIDFGAAILQKDWKNRTVTAGTKGYAAPELFENRPLDVRSDIYSFGMLLFFLFTGTSVKKENRHIQNIDCLKHVSTGWKGVVNRCLKYAPGLRFSSMAEVEKQLWKLTEKPYRAAEAGKAKQQAEKTGVLLCVAGVYPHSGVTHICLALAISFAQGGKSVSYREMREEGVVESLLLQERQKKRKTPPKFCGVRLFRGGEEKGALEHFDVEIRDYGWIQGESSKELFFKKHVLLVTGTNCWELGMLEQTLIRFRYLPVLCMNFVSGKIFLKLAVRYRDYLCIRIPYQPEVFGAYTGQWKKFVQRIWEEALCLEQ